MITLRDQGRIPSRLAATAVLEFDRKESTFFLSSVPSRLLSLPATGGRPRGSSWPRHIHKNPVSQALIQLPIGARSIS